MKNRTKLEFHTNFKTYDEAVVIKMVWNLHKARHIYRSMEQNWESTNKPLHFCQMILEKSANIIQ